VILWKDFILDADVGPLLVCSDEPSSRGVMDDAVESSQIQEMRRKQRPARMVGSSSLDSSKALLGQEADPIERASALQGRDG
jgi:hypothetical protein